MISVSERVIMGRAREQRERGPGVRGPGIVTAELKLKIGPDDPKRGTRSRGLRGVDRAGISWKRENEEGKGV